MERLDVNTSEFVRKHSWLGVKVEVCITDESNVIDVNLFAYNDDNLIDIMVATGEWTTENEAEANKIAKQLAKRYKLDIVHS